MKFIQQLRRSARWAAPLLVGALLPMTGSAATAADGDWEVTSYILPAGAAATSPEELPGVARLAASSRAGLTQGRVPQEVVGPAKEYGESADEPSAVANPSVPRAEPIAAAVTYPDPARTMTAQECKDGLGPGFSGTYVSSRFASCSGHAFVQQWTQNGRPTGLSQFTALAVATVAQDSRTVEIRWHFEDMITQGVTRTSALLITPEPEIPLVEPDSATIRQGGNVPTRLSYDQMRVLGSFLHTLTVDTGDGTGPDDLVATVYRPHIELDFPTGVGGAKEGDLFILPPRWDAAPYLPNSSRGGAASLAYVGFLRYSVQEGAPERAVADHIEWALSAPEETYPPNDEKHIAGGSADDALNRLYYDELRRDRNRRIAVNTCQIYWGPGYTEGGLLECDEFPFASTYQGCAAPRYSDGGYDPSVPTTDCSAFPLLGTENGNAGTLLAQFYDKNRVIDGPDDGFVVEIT